MDDVTREAIEDLRRRVAAMEARLDPFAKMRDAIANLKPARPEGEANDTNTVNEVRKLLADYFLDHHDENLAMRPTLELLARALADARFIDHSRHGHPATPEAREDCRRRLRQARKERDT